MAYERTINGRNEYNTIPTQKRNDGRTRVGGGAVADAGAANIAPVGAGLAHVALAVAARVDDEAGLQLGPARDGMVVNHKRVVHLVVACLYDMFLVGLLVGRLVGCSEGR